jgi:hypothetical protein
VIVSNSQTRNFQLPSLAAWLLLGVVLLGVGSSACARARAASVPNGPPLQVPEPPPRVLAPVEETLASTPAAAEAPASAPVAPVTPRATAPRPAEPRPQPPAAAAVPPPAPAPTETRELRAAPSTTTATERTVRDLLARAARDLGRTDYRRLSAEGRETYDQSRRFSQQAQEALKERNVAFAMTLADKAATLAAELVKQ